MRKYYETAGQADDFPSFAGPDPEPEGPRYAPDDIRSLYPDSFQSDADICIPVGFMPFVKRALEMMSCMGLELKVARIAFSQQNPGHMEAYGRPGGNLHYFNRLLSLTRSICAKCGEEIKPNYLNLCQK